MIERAQDYIWSTARVLEQRRFEFLFGDGEAAPVKAALEPYKTADGGYGYALEPDGRGPTSQPPHIWTALEVLEELGETDQRIGDHLVEITAPDGGVPVALPTLEPWPRAPWWGIGTDGTLLATALVYAHLGYEHRWMAGAASRKVIADSTSYGCVCSIFAMAPQQNFSAPDRERAASEAERLGRLVREQELVGKQPEGYSPGEIHHPHDFAKSPESLARRWFTDAEMERSLDHLAGRQRDDGGWDITWAVWTPAIAIEWSGPMTIAALKILRAFGRC